MSDNQSDNSDDWGVSQPDPAAPAAPAVPDGWVMVPREPTDAMLNRLNEMSIALAMASHFEVYGLLRIGYAGLIENAPGSAPAAPAVQPPMEDPDCNYIAPMGKVCNKCGRIHRGITGDSK